MDLLKTVKELRPETAVVMITAHGSEKIAVEANLVEIENRMKINYRIFDAASGKRLTKAYTVQVALCLKTNEMLFASPRALLDKF